MYIFPIVGIIGGGGRPKFPPQRKKCPPQMSPLNLGGDEISPPRLRSWGGHPSKFGGDTSFFRRPPQIWRGNLGGIASKSAQKWEILTFFPSKHPNFGVWGGYFRNIPPKTPKISPLIGGDVPPKFPPQHFEKPSIWGGTKFFCPPLLGGMHNYGLATM